jgi:hypothetical protein
MRAGYEVSRVRIGQDGSIEVEAARLSSGTNATAPQPEEKNPFDEVSFVDGRLISKGRVPEPEQTSPAKLTWTRIEFQETATHLTVRAFSPNGSEQRLQHWRLRDGDRENIPSIRKEWQHRAKVWNVPFVDNSI